MFRLSKSVWNKPLWSNTLLWGILYILVLHDNLKTFLGDDAGILSYLVYLTLLIAPVYLHNLILIPKFLLKQRYTIYLAYLGLLIFVISFVFSFKDHNFKADLLKYILLLTLAASMNMLKRQITTEIKNKNAALLQRDMELNSLKAQINPHFLFNTLNNIYALTLNNSPEAPNIVLQLAGLMRYQLESTKKNLVSLDEEIKFLKQYFELEKMRVGDKVSLEFNINLDKYTLWIPPMILMTFVENAFKHGINTSNNKSWIKILINSNKQVLTMKVENTKSNYKTPIARFGGFGLKNVKRRLTLTLPNKYKIKVSENKDIYTTIIKLKL